MMTSPLVSIIMATYNTNEEHLLSAIKSILNQSLKDFEFIIIDDGSQKNDVNIVRSFNDKRIKLFINEKNIGLAASLNRGLQLANGKYVARMDSDDISVHHRLKKQVEFLESNPNIDILGSAFRYFGSKNRTVSFPEENEVIRATLLFLSPVCHPSVMFRNKTIQEKKISYSIEQRAEDYDLWARCSKMVGVNFANISKVLLKYRIHKSQMTNKSKTSLKKSSSIIRQRLLYELDVEFTQDDVRLYEKFASGHILTKKEYMEVERLIFEIIKKNKDKKIYKETILLNTMANKYRKECCRAFTRLYSDGDAYFSSQIKQFVSKSYRIEFLMFIARLCSWKKKCKIIRGEP